jgi:DNA-binding transcriptional MerR regulator
MTSDTGDQPGNDAGSMTPRAMADACGVSIDTLRYYEREGLLDPVARNESGQRRYSADDAAWVQVLRCLRTTAMPIRDMRTFAELVRQGDDAIPQRLAILEQHRSEVVAKMAELERALEVIDEKVTVYRMATDGNPTVQLDPADRQPTLDGKGARA